MIKEKKDFHPIIKLVLVVVTIAAVAFALNAMGVLGDTKWNVNILSNPDLEDGLILHWTFEGEDMVSNVADRSGTGNDGYLSGFTSTTTITGRIGQALSFDGTDDFASTTLSDTVNSIAFWLKPDSTTEDIINFPSSDGGGSFLSGYSYRVKFEINPDFVDSTLTSFPVLVDLSTMPSTFFDNVGDANCGDVRVTESDETTETPRELVDCDTSADTGELWFLADSVSSTATTTFYIYYGNASASDYDPTDPNGRNAVWTNYELVWHGASLTDSTGNGNDPSAVSGATLTTQDGRLTGSYDGSGARHDFGDVTFLDGINTATWEWEVYRPSAWPDSIISVVRKDTAWTPFQWRGSTDKWGAFLWTTGINGHNSGVDVETAQWVQQAYTYDGSTRTMYKAGSSVSTHGDTGNLANSSNPLVLGANESGSEAYDGYIRGLKISASTLGSDWLGATYNNRSTPSDFYFIGAEEENSSNGSISLSSGTLSASGFSSPTIYVDGEVSSSISDTGWHHVVVTDSSGLAVDDMHVGRIADSYFSGTLDDIRVYDRALSATEVSRLYGLGGTTRVNLTLNTNPVLTGDLVGHWTLDGKETSSTTATDISGNSNNGTLSGWVLQDYDTVVNALGPEARFGLNGNDGTDSTGNGHSASSGSASAVDPLITHGSYANSADFNGSTDEFLIPDADEINTGATYNGSERAISVWINADTIDTTGNGRAIWSEGGGVISMNMYVFNDGVDDRVYCNASEDSGATNDSVSAVISENTTYHVGCMWDYAGGRMDMYINGSLQDSDTSLAVGTSLGEHSGNIAIGGQDQDTLNHAGNTMTANYDGTLADLVYWTAGTVISESDFNDIYTTGALADSFDDALSIGRLGQALTFDGVDDFIDVGNLSNGIQTAAFWIKAATTTTNLNIIDIDGTDKIETDGSGNIIATSFPASTIYVNGSTASAAITAGEWHHVAIVDTSGVDATDFDIGRIEGEGNFGGELDDVRIYTKALPEADVLRLYQLGATTHINTTIGTGDDGTSSLANGLVGHWTFDGKYMYENVADSSGSGNTGYLSGQTSTSTVIGKIGQALEFDGSDDHVEASLPSPFSDIANNDFSVAFWTRPENLDVFGTWTRVTEIFDDSNNRFAAAVPTENAITFFVETANVSHETRATGLSLGTWYHFVLTWDADTDTDTLYMNGEVQSNVNPTDLFSDSGQGTWIGASAGGGANYTGAFDDYRVYNRVLSAEEIQRIYNLGR